MQAHDVFNNVKLNLAHNSNLSVYRSMLISLPEQQSYIRTCDPVGCIVHGERFWNTSLLGPEIFIWQMVRVADLLSVRIVKSREYVAGCIAYGFYLAFLL